MKVYDVEGFPNPARVRIALAEKGVTDQIEFVPVNVMSGEHRQPEFLAKNPGAGVPVLELDCGTCISECTAITEYIDHSFVGPSLTGNTAKERATIHMMNRRAESGLLDAVGAYFHHATPGLGPDLETHQLPEYGMAQKDKAQHTMAYLDTVLQTQDYLAGDRFTMADITAFAGLTFADFVKIEIPAELTALSDWRKRVGSRASCGG